MRGSSSQGSSASPGGLPQTCATGSRGSLVSITGAPGASSPPTELLGASALGWELGVEGPDVLIGDGQVGGSHARGVLRGEGTQLARPEPPPRPPATSHPAPRHRRARRKPEDGEGRLLPICTNPQLICCAHGCGDRLGLASLSPSWNFGKTPKKTSSPCPARGAQ